MTNFIIRAATQMQGLHLYWRTTRLLKESQAWDEQRHAEYQVARLRSILLHCAVNVPYYRGLLRKIGFDPAQVRDVSDLAAVPMLDKETVRSNAQALTADNIPKSRWNYYTTGGTMGAPLGLYGLKGGGWRERAFIEAMWQRVGFKPTRLRAMLKGAAVNTRTHYTYNPVEHAFLFSNFHMRPDVVSTYASVMKKWRIPFLHTYPSAALDFARILKERGISPPHFEAIFIGSENLYPGQREAIEKFYGCRAFSWYGHSENTILAGECEVSNHYHIFPEYGLLEVIKPDGRLATEEGEQGEMVGTTLYNPVMPLLRYRTGDWAEIGPKNCPCGRKYRLLSGTRGRWLQEMLIGRFHNRISMTALNMHTAIFDHVQQFQFYQREIGKAELRLIRKASYSDRDSALILQAFKEKIGDTIDLELKFVEELPRTERGKFRFVIQELPHEMNLQSGTAQQLAG